MNKEWCEKQNKKVEEEYKELRMDIRNYIYRLLLDMDIDLTIKEAYDLNEYLTDIRFSYRLLVFWFKHLAKRIGNEGLFEKAENDGLFKKIDSYKDKSYYIDKDDKCYCFNRYMDSDIVNFDGDVLITDPCYIMNDEDNGRDDWTYCNYGSDMEKLGITTYITNDTIYGDWSCHMYDDKKREVGRFCADAGLVSIIDLKQALEYNEKGVYELISKQTWCATVITNFKGTGQVKVKEVTYTYDGEEHTDYEAYVELIGIDKSTGNKVHFISQQTGL